MTPAGSVIGRLDARPARDAPELLAEPVRAALATLADEHLACCRVAEIDPALADTAALCAHYDVPLLLPGAVPAMLPGAEVIDGLGLAG